jgi:uncharacterized protein YkwD
MNIKRLFLYVAVALAGGFLLFQAGNDHGRDSYTVTLQQSVASEKTVADYVSDVRVSKGLAVLERDPTLDATAKIKAEDLASKNYWSHDTPDGLPFYDMIRKNRPGTDLIGENLGKCFKSNKELIDAWVASEPHLANIVKTDYKKIGSYVLWDADQLCFVAVNHFGV